MLVPLVHVSVAYINEASRDMARADVQAGHNVYFIDAGITIKGKLEKPQIGAIDNRAGFKLETANPTLLDDADIIIMHTGVSDSYLVRNQAPLLWVVHGRPLACFRPERMGNGQSYSLYNTVSNWKRTKGMLYFWKEFQPHWEGIFNNKDIILDYPVIDENRFSITKAQSVLKSKGKINILVCDSAREDIDNYELTIGLCEAAKVNPEIKVHFYGIDMVDGKLSNCYNLLLGKLKALGALGDVSGRVTEMEKIFNSVDCIISPNKIITRTIGEALSCGVPVISHNNTHNLVSDYTCDMTDPADIAEAVGIFVHDKKNDLINKNEIRDRASVFSLKNYSDKMSIEYKRIVEGGIK